MGNTNIAPFVVVAFASLVCQRHVQANDFKALDRALPLDFNLTSIIPVFDFDGDGCYPSSAISRKGELNEGLKPHGTLGSCRNSRFLFESNTYHRYACVVHKMTEYCGHSFALYMLKDQTSTALWGLFSAGDRHDWSSVILWTVDGKWVYASCEMKTYGDNEIPLNKDGRPKFVYHQPYWSGYHFLRKAKEHEAAENEAGSFVTPPIVSWFTMKGDGVSNKRLRDTLTKAEYPVQSPFPFNDTVFLDDLNSLKPRVFPNFTQASLDNSQ